MSRLIESTATFAPRWKWTRAIMVALAVFASARFATAQVFVNGAVMMADDDEEASADDLRKPFIFPGKSNESGEAMADFQRYSKRGTWEKAFRALEKVVSAQTAGLAAGKDGLMIPSSVLIQQTLADLPATGKDAYRLFHDADAKGHLEKARDRDELEKLKLVATAYLFTAVGDAAAERLGDYYFEQGELDRAAAAWRSVLVHRPDSAIPRARLLVKTAIALARDKRWLAFDEIRKQVDERYATDTVELGGHKVAAAEHLKKLAAERATEAPASSDKSQSPAMATDLLPATDAEAPLWRFRLIGKTPSTARQLAGWVGQAGSDDEAKSQDTVPAIVVDGGRLYANYIGCYVAIDLETGKLLWKTGKLEGKIRTMRQYGFYAPEQFPLTLAKDRLWSTSREIDPNGRVNPQFHLYAHEAATGKEVFNSKTVADLQSWNITSAPLVTDDVIYVTASPTSQGMQHSLLALSPSDGKIRWQAQLGSTKIDGRQNYYAARMARPSLLARGPKIYVDTNAGGFVEVDRERGELNWGVVYELEQPYQRRMWYEPVYKARWSSAPLFYEGTLFFKGMGSGRLYAVDPSGPTIEWKRSVADSSMLVGVDAERVYLDGEELSAIDRATKKMVWSRRLPASSSFVWPLLTANRIYRMTPRGIFELDKKTGHVERVFRGADTDTLGGSLALTPKALLAVSNLGITAYPLPGASEKTQATNSDAAGSDVETNTATTAK